MEDRCSDFEKVRDGYTHNYDDQYKVLATNLVGDHSTLELKRMMTDVDYIRLLIKHEVQESMDLVGPFSDCIIEILLSEDKVGYKNEQAKFAMYLASKLDVKRLRDEISSFCDLIGIDLS